MPNSIAINAQSPTITESDALYARALGLIPSVTQTLAKGPGQYPKGVSPKYAKRAKGAHIWDVDGNQYIDYQMGIGPISLGYAYDEVDDAIRAQLADGITFSLMHPLEVEVAELLRSIIPNAEQIRYSKTGADVCSAAVRAARAYTGRNKILCCGYHGWHDWYIAVTARNYGIPQAVQDLTYTINYNDLDSLRQSLDADTAAVILEPAVFQVPDPGYHQALIDICHANGTLVIFDEMWTGFRFALGGAQEYFGVKPDLAVYSKAICNGMPLAVLAGRSDVMQLFDEAIFFYTTFGGEALSLAAAKATIGIMQRENVSAYLFAKGQVLREGYNAIAQEYGIDSWTRCSGFDCRTIVTFDATAGDPLILKSLLQQEMIRHGVLWGGFHNMSFSHTDADLNHTLEAYRHALRVLANAVADNKVRETLKGEPIQAVFRRVGDFNIKPVFPAAQKA